MNAESLESAREALFCHVLCYSRVRREGREFLVLAVVASARTLFETFLFFSTKIMVQPLKNTLPSRIFIFN